MHMNEAACSSAEVYAKDEEQTHSYPQLPTATRCYPLLPAWEFDEVVVA